MTRRLLAAFAVLAAAAIALPLSISHAEPWLSNRFAQNCASCHSPSRRNVVAKDRRCTLACQGCHVNPSGGGLRNDYGVWNQQRWLRSGKSEFFGSKGTPAPLKYQKFADMPDNMSGSRSEAYQERDENRADERDTNEKSKKGKTAKSKDKKSRKPNAETTAQRSGSSRNLNRWEEMAREGAPLVVIQGVDYNEKDYDKSDRQEHITVGSRTEFLARLTEDDPWRTERKNSVFAGGDFRYFYLDGSYDSDTSDFDWKGKLLPMSFDFGVKVRPTPEKVSLVFENRSYNFPNPNEEQSSPEKVFANSIVRSAYLLVDDLPYATYFQYGLYRPLFGHSNPDHTSLVNSIMTADNTGGNYNDYGFGTAKWVNKVFTIGGSPNVPFINAHVIMPRDTDSPSTWPSGGFAFARDRGYAVNLGGRFVTLGASFMLSYWQTEGPRPGNPTGEDLKNNMWSVNAGGTYKDFIVNFDITNVEREFAVGSSDSGGVTTTELKYRFWRENYAVFNYATSNVARNLKQGEATEMMYGWKSFLFPGSEFELLMISRVDKNGLTDVETKYDVMQAQLHLFF